MNIQEDIGREQLVMSMVLKRFHFLGTRPTQWNMGPLAKDRERHRAGEEGVWQEISQCHRRASEKGCYGMQSGHLLFWSAWRPFAVFFQQLLYLGRETIHLLLMVCAAKEG